MQQAQNGLQRVMRQLLAEMPVEEAVVRAWPLACGSATAARTEALGFAGGVLTVRVPNREWMANLRELAGTYLAALRGHCGEAVRRIDFVLAEQPDGVPAGEPGPGLNWVRSRR